MRKRHQGVRTKRTHPAHHVQHPNTPLACFWGGGKEGFIVFTAVRSSQKRANTLETLYYVNTIHKKSEIVFSEQRLELRQK